MRLFVAATVAFLLAAPPALAMEAPTELLDKLRAETYEEYTSVKEITGIEDMIPDPVDRHIDGALATAEDEPVKEEAPAEAPGFAERFREAAGGPMMMAGLAGLGATALGLGGFSAVTRYISPKEALKNPQRAMLYGFIRATPGAHLKQLSEEFKMKTSSILWHIRKLESADLVHSERANGFRVFYPSEGGIEAKRLSRAITALHNQNAQSIQESINRQGGRTVKDIAERLNVHTGTVRWHLRKLRDFGLLEELVSDDASRFYPTPLGKKAIEAALGTPTAASPSAKSARSAVDA